MCVIMCVAAAHARVRCMALVATNSTRALPTTGQEAGYDEVRYTRCSNNPTQEALGAKVAELEGACFGLQGGAWDTAVVLQSRATLCGLQLHARMSSAHGPHAVPCLLTTHPGTHALQARRRRCRWRLAWRPSVAPYWHCCRRATTCSYRCVCVCRCMCRCGWVGALRRPAQALAILRLLLSIALPVCVRVGAGRCVWWHVRPGAQRPEGAGHHCDHD